MRVDWNDVKPYRARQLSIAWFDAYLLGSGIVLNVLFVVSIISLFVPANGDAARVQRARIELEDSKMCTKHLGGRDFAPTAEFAITLYDGKEFPISYKSQSTYGYTKSGNSIEMVSAGYSESERGLLFLIVSPEKKIEGCVSAFNYPSPRNQQLDCLASAGDYDDKGTCRLPVNQASDCQVMNGTLADGLCVVAAGNRILRPGQSASSSRRTCVEPGCKTK